MSGFKWKPVSDADLAALGYYRLDVDVEALPSVRDALFSYRELVPNAAAINEAVALIGQVLAALDGEEA